MRDFSGALIKEYQQPLAEKWELFDTSYGPMKLWHSDSASEVRSFLTNAASAGISGLRLCISGSDYFGDLYLAARASDLNHDDIIEIAEKNYLDTAAFDRRYECSTCGFPKLANFDFDNFELTQMSAGTKEMRDAEDADEAKEYRSYAGKTVLDPWGDTLWVHDGKKHMLVADCGSFEVALYGFYSEQFPEFRWGDRDKAARMPKALFERSETYFILKPLIKKLYITNI
jgi:hypothetical protein